MSALVHARRIRVLPALLAGAALLLSVLALVPASADAQSKSELRSRAYHVMTRDYHTFHNMKIRQHPRPFDWRDNGCTTRNVGFAGGLPTGVIHRHYMVLFDWPCEQHDFGYRNYGGGLKLNRSEKARGWIDWRLYVETQRACANRYRGKPARRRACKAYSLMVYKAVRKGGGKAFYG
jgi:hypothetical protein